MNFVYGVTAALVRRKRNAYKEQLLNTWHQVGTSALVDQIAGNEKPGEAAFYGLTIREEAKAEARGAIAGALA